MVFLNIQFYVSKNCSLCEDARYQLAFFKESISKEVNIETIYIEEKEELLERYMIRVPIVEYKGVVLQEGNIDFVTLIEKLEQNL